MAIAAAVFLNYVNYTGIIFQSHYLVRLIWAEIQDTTRRRLNLPIVGVSLYTSTGNNGYVNVVWPVSVLRQDVTRKLKAENRTPDVSDV
tara:strand:- start:1692 stop:1958 length:267 start_codon:yes stop_codon:yes gene_type:complete